MIEHADYELGARKKCELLGINRSRIYYKKKLQNRQDEEMMNAMKNIYMKHPFYGYRKMHAVLTQEGYVVNHKKVQRLMALAGLKAIYPKRKTTIRNKQHKTYPFLLAKKDISHPNAAWKTDITYIKMRSGFIYLVCLIDVFSRRIMGWKISVTLDAQFCIDALNSALTNAKPEIINSDQGCQFTCSRWIENLERENIQISMDGKGRWADNIHIERFWRSLKYESVFLQSFDSVAQARQSIDEYIKFYNYERPHQSLGYRTPDSVYRTSNRKELKCENKITNSIKTVKNCDSQIQANFWS